MNRVKTLAEYGQSIYLDEINRKMLKDGSLEKLIRDVGIRGVTSNPSIFEKAIVHSDDYDKTIEKMARQGKTAAEIYEDLVVTDIRDAADLFLPLYRASDSRYGYVSLEVSPLLAQDSEATIAEAKHLWQKLDRPNVFIKVPSTKAGLFAIESLISEGINVNVTLIFSLSRYREVARAYTNGLEKRKEAGKSLKNVASVASFFLSRIDVKLDPVLEKQSLNLAGKAAVASAKEAYQIYLEVFGKDFAELKKAGARPQRLLWASTGTKNPNYDDLLYVSNVIGEDTINTLPTKTLEAFLDHGEVSATLEDGVGANDKLLKEIAAAGIDLEKSADELEEEGVEKFVQAFNSLMAAIELARAKAMEADNEG